MDVLHRDAPEQDFPGEDHPADRGVKRPAQPRAGPGRQQHRCLGIGQVEAVADGGADRSADLDDRSLATGRATGPDTDRRRDCLRRNDVQREPSAFPVDRLDHLRNPLASHQATAAVAGYQPDERAPDGGYEDAIVPREVDGSLEQRRLRRRPGEKQRGEPDQQVLEGDGAEPAGDPDDDAEDEQSATKRCLDPLDEAEADGGEDTDQGHTGAATRWDLRPRSPLHRPRQ